MAAREQPLLLKIFLNLCGPLGVGLALLGYINAGLGLFILLFGIVYIGWEVYPSAHDFVRRSPWLSLPVFLSVGLGLGFCAWMLLSRINPRPSNPPSESQNLPDLKPEIDRVLPLWNYKPLQAPPGVPVQIPQGKAPTTKDVDTNIAVVGKIINPRDVQASAEHWEISFRLADGNSVVAELLVPPIQLVISYPSGKSPDILNIQDYWPRKLDMQTIPAHGVSYGFVFGVLRGVTPAQFDKPGTSVTLCFQDADGRRYCDTLMRKNDAAPHHHSPPAPPSVQLQPLASLTDGQRYLLKQNLSQLAGKEVRLVHVGNDPRSEIVFEQLNDIFSDAGWKVQQITIGMAGVVGVNFPNVSYLTSGDISNTTVGAVFSIFSKIGLDLPLVPDAFMGPPASLGSAEVVIVVH